MRDLEVFAQAIEIEDEEKRAKFIVAACKNDSALRLEVLRLLDAFSRADQMLEDHPVGNQLAEQLSRAFEASSDGVVAAQETDHGGYETTIGPYRLIEKIGEGGFGEVFVAQQYEPVKRRVAIKIIKPGMDSKEVVARFSAESQALAIMNHPNIAKVLDVGTTPRGLPYFVMELVPGIPITDYCDRGKLTLAERLQLFIDTCRAIQHAHQKGIIHRDIKPTNILITTQDGLANVKVIDFGVAKAINQRLTDVTIYTRSSFMIGTPAYMSPEQADLNKEDIDTRTDVYSLGAVLYELLVGSPPFEAERFKQASIDEMRKIIREQEPVRPSSRIIESIEQSHQLAALRSTAPKPLHASLKGDLDWIVIKALSKDRARRYESASGLAADVQRYLSGQAILARPPSWTYVTSRFARRHRGLVTAVCTVLSILVVGIISSVVLAAWALTERSAARKNELIAFGQTKIADGKSLEADQAKKRAQAAEDAALRSLLDAKLSFIKLNVWSGRPGQQIESLRATREAADLAKRTAVLDNHLVEMRTQAISALTRVDVQLQKVIRLSEAAYYMCARSADLGTMAYRIREADGDYVTIRTTEEPATELQRVAIPFDTRSSFHDAVHLNLSSDARYLTIMNGEHGTFVWDLQKRKKLLLAVGASWPYGHDFSPDGSQIAILEFYRGDKYSRLRIFSTQGNSEGELLREISDEDAFAFVSYSPDGRHLAVSTVNGVSLLETSSWKVVGRFPMPRWQNDHCIDWSTNGEYLAAGYNNEIWIWQVANGLEKFRKITPTPAGSTPNDELAELKPAAILRGHKDYVEQICFHPQHSTLLASSAWDGTTRLWDFTCDGPQLVLSEGSPKFSSDGQRLSTTRSTSLQIYELSQGDACMAIDKSGHHQAIFDPQERWLAIGSAVDSGHCRLFALPSLKPLGKLPASPSLGLAWDAEHSKLKVGNSLGIYDVPVSIIGGSQLQLGPALELLATKEAPFCQTHCTRNGRWILTRTASGHAPILQDSLTGYAAAIHRTERGLLGSFSGNGRWLALGFLNHIEIVDPETGQSLSTVNTARNPFLTFSRDDRLLIACGMEGSHIINTSDWSIKGKFPDSQVSVAAGCSFDSRYVVLTQERGEFGIVNLDHATLATKLARVDASGAESIVCSPSGRYILTVANRGATLLWDMQIINQRLNELGIPLDPAWPIANQSDDSKKPSDEMSGFNYIPGQLDLQLEFEAAMSGLSPEDVVKESTPRIEAGCTTARAYAARAAAFQQLDNYEAALADWRSATTKSPHVNEWWWELGDAQFCLKQYSDALNTYRRLVDAKTFYSLDAIGKISLMMSYEPQAIEDLAAWRQQLDEWTNMLDALGGADPNRPVSGHLVVDSQRYCRAAIGVAWLTMDEEEKALQMLNIPDSHQCEAWFALAAIHARQGKLAQAKKELQTGLQYRQGYGGGDLKIVEWLQRQAELAIKKAE